MANCSQEEGYSGQNKQNFPPLYMTYSSFYYYRRFWRIKRDNTFQRLEATRCSQIHSKLHTTPLQYLDIDLSKDLIFFRYPKEL